MKMTSPLPPPGKEMGHYVSEAPFDVMSIEKISPEQEKVYLAPQWKLMWWKFKQHRIAVWCGVFLGILYATIFISEFSGAVQYSKPSCGSHLLASARGAFLP